MKASNSQIIAVVALAFLSTHISTAGAATQIDRKLGEFLKSGVTAEKTEVLVLLSSTADVKKPLRQDRAAVLNYLREKSALSEKELLQSLAKQGLSTSDVLLKKTHWINNAFTLEVTPRGLKALGNNALVKKIYANGNVNFDSAVKKDFSVTTLSEINYAFQDTGRYKLLEEYPDITGEATVVGVVDTGIDGGHEALEGKIGAFFNAQNGKVSKPFDADSHGTHVSGTIAGTKTKAGFDFGMAPSATIVGSAALSSYGDMLTAMEWIIDPDSNASTDDAPRAINNSWNTNGAPDQEPFYRAIDAWDAAGILPVFSAGNAGPDPASITHPHEYPLTLAIGATGSDGKIVDFSSRGPGKWNGEETMKPDITAPGEDIFSSIPGNEYAKYSGTSMASPHATGSVALLYQVAPWLTTDEVRAILTATAIPTSEDGDETDYADWNAVYGFGKLDIYTALQEVLYYSGTEFGANALSLNSVMGFNTMKDLRVQKLKAIRNRKVEFNPESARNAGTSGDWITLENI